MCKDKDLLECSTCDEDTLYEKLELAFLKSTQGGDLVAQNPPKLELVF